MEFFIGKNANLPLLKFQVVKDGRQDYQDFMNFIESSTIYFSMKDEKSGAYRIQLKQGGFVSKVFEDPNTPTEYYVYYKFTKKDTKKIGRYEGQFLLKNEIGTLILPIREPLYINITDSTIPVNEPETNIITLSSTYFQSSIGVTYYASILYPVQSDVIISFTNVLGTLSGPSVVISTSITIPANETFATVTLTLDGDYNNLNKTSLFYNITTNTEYSTVFNYSVETNYVFELSPTPTPTPTNPCVQFITDELGNIIISESGDYIISELNTCITPTPTKTPTPTNTPTLTNTPTPSITPSNTSTVTPTVTPTITPSPSQQPLYPLTLYIQPLSGGQAIIFNGITYTAQTTVNILLNTFYDIEAVPIPGYMFIGWNIFGGSFSSTGQSTTVAISLTSGANLAPSYDIDPNFDALEYQLTTSLIDYQNATNNNWVRITQQEYNNIFNNVDGVGKIGNSDQQVNTRNPSTGFVTTTFGTVDVNTPLTIPTGYYIVGFVAESWNQNGQVQLGYTTTYHTGSPNYMGNSPSVIGGTTMFYVRKRPSYTEGAPASQNLYPVLNFLSPAYPNSVPDTFGWQTPNSGTTWFETISSSQTAKIQILLTNVLSWPTTPPPNYWQITNCNAGITISVDFGGFVPTQNKVYNMTFTNYSPPNNWDCWIIDFQTVDTPYTTLLTINSGPHDDCPSCPI